MRTKIVIIALLSVVTVAVNAQIYKNTYTPSAQQEYEVIQSQQIMSANVHEGTIYEPFSSTTPSEQSAVGVAQEPSSGPNRAKKDFVNPSDPGHQSNEYPLGDGLWPLMLCAVAFAAGVAVRRRKKA